MQRYGREDLCKAVVVWQWQGGWDILFMLYFRVMIDESLFYLEFSVD